MSFGYTQALWLKESAAYGSSEDLSTGTRYVLPVKPNISVEKTLARIKTEHIRGTAGMKQEEDQLGIESVQGSFGGVVPCKGDFGIVFKNAIGKVVSAGVAAPYSHIYTWNDKLFVGFSLAINKGDATYVSHGCQFKSLKLSAKAGGPLEWTADIIGAKEVQIATVTAPTLPTLLAGTPYWLFQHGSFEIDDMVEPMTEFSIDFLNELAESDDSSYSIGNVLRSLLPRTGYGVTGTVKRRHNKDATQVSKFYAKFLAGTVGKLEFTFVNPSDANYSLLITLGVVKFEGKTPNASDKGMLFEEIPFVAYDLDQATSSINVSDAQAAPVTATGAYDGAGA